MGLAENYRAIVIKQGMLIAYTPYTSVPGNVDVVTEEVIDEETAYPESRAFGVRAMVQVRPSEKERERLGLAKECDATVEIPKQFLTSNGIAQPKERDKIQIPELTFPVFVTEFKPSKIYQGAALCFILGTKRVATREWQDQITTD
jgi:hypothetical protein